MARDEMFGYALSQPGAEDSTMHGGRCIRVREVLGVAGDQGPARCPRDVTACATPSTR